MAGAKMSELITCGPAVDRIWLYVFNAMERHLNAIDLALEVGDRAD